MILPDLMTPETAAQRGAALNAFIESWLGPRRPEFGVPDAELATVEMPAPLARLYRFAGNWACEHPDRPGRRSPFGRQDHLRPVAELSLNANGQLEFLDECQGAFVCATDRSGEDAAVYIKHEGRKSHELAVPLSRFLVTYCLQELLFSAQFYTTDTPVVEWAESRKSDWRALWEDPYTGKRKSQFFCLDESFLIGKTFGFTSIAANTEEAVAKLRDRQGEIRRIYLYVHRPPHDAPQWTLSIAPDGAATFGIFMRKERLTLPAGTFDFRGILQRVEGKMKPQGQDRSVAMIAVDRVGRQGGLEPRLLMDLDLARLLIDTALAGDTDGALCAEFAEDDPFGTA